MNKIKSMNKTARIQFYTGSAILIIVLFFSIFAPFLMKYPFDLPNLDNVWAKASSNYFFGADNLGRDIYSRLVWGTRESLVIGIVVELLTLPIGLLLGFLCGYSKNIITSLIANVAELFYAFPTILLAMLIAVILGPGKISMIIAITLGSWPYFYRLTRSLVIKLKKEPFIEASEAMGAGTFHIFKKHIIPNVIPVITPNIILDIGGTIMCESTLSFLGIGIQAPVPSLGNMIRDGLSFMSMHPSLVIVSCTALAVIMLALTFVGDSLSEGK